MRRVNDLRSREMLEETEEYKRGDMEKLCTGCYLPHSISTYSTFKYEKVRRLISWCKDCVKAKRLLPPNELVLVNRGGRVHVRKRKGGA